MPARHIITVILIIISVPLSAKAGLLQRHLRHETVRSAKREKDALLKAVCEAKNIPYPPHQVFLRAFKKDGVFEVWAQKEPAAPYVLLKTYPICEKSGTLGPKRRQGDLQVPEGFYHITTYHPDSTFYLSLRVNYPNRSDRILGYKPKLGGSILVHGECCTIGCIPLTNDLIKEVYWLTLQVYAKTKKRIHLHIFPTRLDGAAYRQLTRTYQKSPELLAFWENLRPGFLFFEQYKKVPLIRVRKDGRYFIRK